MDVAHIQQQLREFAVARDWPQFHTPKNLVMAMSVEMAELLEHFQWLTPEQAVALKDDPARLDAVGQEMADVMMYMLRLADVLGVDLGDAIARKMVLNAIKYPAP
ncbi:nucleotide pyrophosphohydrolase [Amantichitinum ursilacus]|uniref:MazG nucleotide pyrophosphohydrolase domain protein n=1 Tax=Amantichitinum ursilacus TaxID=857265 RepID=A0A0N0XIU6_9NEIS|nr:nucleotide pyrophosphohydrolase [Amantichitinum ursilacus]KPC53059.1 hypothetical protein WG78_11230 [Amantichitinum ursilacus]